VPRPRYPCQECGAAAPDFQALCDECLDLKGLAKRRKEYERVHLERPIGG
jgi:predicted ATP-dependent serine protease